MAKTTKAQRRAAKLNRRSRDYRRQIAAQARKEEQAKKQTHTKANPSPKKVYRPKMNANTQEVYKGNLHNTHNFDVFVNYTLSDDYEVRVMLALHNRNVPATDYDYEVNARSQFNTDKPIIVVKFPYGVSLAMADQAATQEGMIDIMASVLVMMECEGFPFYCVTSSHLGDMLQESGVEVTDIIIDADTAA